MYEGFQEGLNWAPLMPRHANLSAEDPKIPETEIPDFEASSSAQEKLVAWKLQKIISAVRESSAFQHNGGLMKGPP